tara:strand:- start:614 stop:949 length:336 start_codon:yes stop_codon:yes gene_type:complete
MKIINPTDATHTFDFIPRFYEIGYTVDVSLYQESIRVEDSEVVGTFNVTNGFMDVTITASNYSDLTFSEDETYQLKVTDVDNGNILYRGKVLATTQTTQTFKLTEGLYDYE